MDQNEKTATAPVAAENDHRERIAALMALPIKAPPAVTIFGDDDVTGFTPAQD